MPIQTEIAISVLEACKKTGERDYFSEYEINLDLVESMLLEGGFPCDELEDLSKYALDLAAMAVFKHHIGCNDRSTSLGDCYALFVGRHETNKFSSVEPVENGIITDLSWNQTLEQIIDMLKED